MPCRGWGWCSGGGKVADGHPSARIGGETVPPLWSHHAGEHVQREGLCLAATQTSPVEAYAPASAPALSWPWKGSPLPASAPPPLEGVRF